MLTGGEIDHIHGPSPTPLLFNIYMKPLDEVIHHFLVWYYQYGDDIHLYIPILHCGNEAIEVQAQCGGCLC